jgi:catechol 2,3-dioxygenase-like lactoylglutathione lyase family enzyme
MIRGIHHTSLPTRDLERLISFYTRVLGFELVTRFEWSDTPIIDDVVGLPGSAAKGAMLRTGNCHLELFEYSRPAGRPHDPLRPCDDGYTHICLDVTDIESEYERLMKAGMTFNAPPQDFGDNWATYGWDPDGNIIEIQQTARDHIFSMTRLRQVRFD